MTMEQYQIKRAMIDEWELLGEQIFKGMGVYAALDQETKDEAMRAVVKVLKFLRTDTGSRPEV